MDDEIFFIISISLILITLYILVEYGYVVSRKIEILLEYIWNKND